MKVFIDFVYKTKIAFGFVVQHNKISAGDQYGVTVIRTMDSAQFGNASVFTKGRISGVREDGSPLPFDRVPGVTSLGRDSIPGGSYVFTAVEDSEWWCINFRANKFNREFFDISVVTLAPGESRAIDVGAKLFLCDGSMQMDGEALTAGQPLPVPTEQKTITALTDCYCFSFP